MSYQRRVFIATIASVILHGLLFWIGSKSAQAIPKREFQAATETIVFRFEPEIEVENPTPRDAVKSLISTPIPTTEEVEETDLISDHDSKAQDLSDEEGERAAPHVDTPEEFDRVQQLASPEQAPVPESENTVEPIEPVEPTPQVEAVKPARTAEPQPPAAEVESVDTPTIIEEMLEGPKPPRKEIADNPEEEVPEEPEELQEEAEETVDEVETPEPFKIAQAEPEPQVKELPKFSQEISAARGRADGGTLNTGIMNFEATKHELGEYMLEVRRLVERKWRVAIQLQYPGVKRTTATLDLVIRPSGIIDEIRIVDSGESMSFALLCRESMKKAGPFPELPFEVPEIYRSQNIEIRWKFSYL